MEQSSQFDAVASASSGRICVLEEYAEAPDSVTSTLRARGFAVDFCPSETRTLRLGLMARRNYDLAVLDTAACADDGVEVFTLLAGRAGQRTLVLTGEAAPDFEVRCLDAGAADCLAKPVTSERLDARVRALMRRLDHFDTAGRFLCVNDLTLDLERRVALDAHHEVALSKREFGLLLYLMRRPGAICSREQILAAVWNTPFDPGTNVVDVYVRRLRNKLGGGRIETLRTVGYSLRSHDRPTPAVTPQRVALHQIG